MGSEAVGKPGELSSLHYLQVPKPDVVTVPTAISRDRSSEPLSRDEGDPGAATV